MCVTSIKFHTNTEQNNSDNTTNKTHWTGYCWAQKLNCGCDSWAVVRLTVEISHVWGDGMHRNSLLGPNQCFWHLLNPLQMQVQPWKLKGSSCAITLWPLPIRLLTRHRQTKARKTFFSLYLFKNHSFRPHTITHVQLLCSTQDRLNPICPPCSTASAEIATKRDTHLIPGCPHYRTLVKPPF